MKLFIHSLTIGYLLLVTTVYAQDNQLTPKEQKAGFKLLYDGKSTKGWHNFRKTDISPKWLGDSGTLHLTERGGGDIVSNEEFENFELLIDWKISPAGNSGIFYLVSEDTSYKTVWQTGPECQVLDNHGHRDGQYPNHTSGSLYDLIVPSKDVTKPIGEFNQARIVLKDGKLEHWLNGLKVIETTLWTPEWNEMVAKSKFKSMPGFAKFHKGHIALQDHGDKVWFKNIKIRKF